MNRLHGPPTITAAGSALMEWAGVGFPAVTGRPRGYHGVAVTIASVGRPSHPRQSVSKETAWR